MEERGYAAHHSSITPGPETPYSLTLRNRAKRYQTDSMPYCLSTSAGTPVHWLGALPT